MLVGLILPPSPSLLLLLLLSLTSRDIYRERKTHTYTHPSPHALLRLAISSSDSKASSPSPSPKVPSSLARFSASDLALRHCRVDSCAKMYELIAVADRVDRMVLFRESRRTRWEKNPDRNRAHPAKIIPSFLACLLHSLNDFKGYSHVDPEGNKGSRASW